MSKLSERMRKAREFSREIGGFNLVLRRPTDEEAATVFRDQVSPIHVAKQFVVGWDGVTEAQLVRSGGEDRVPFDAELWAEVVVDRPDLWEPITLAITEAWSNHNDGREQRAKN